MRGGVGKEGRMKGAVASAEVVESPPKKYGSMKEVMKRARHVSLPIEESEKEEEDVYRRMMCEECGEGDRENELLLCDVCNKGYHMLCARPIVPRVPIGPWFCPLCSPLPLPLPPPPPTTTLLLQRFPQKKIIDFFRIQKCGNVPDKCQPTQDTRKRRRRSSVLVLQKKRRRLLLFTPTEDDSRRLAQMSSLAYALTTLKIEFSNELTYKAGMAPRSANQAEYENGGMQVLSREDFETLEQCKAMCKRGACPPLLVVFDSCEGFTVEADGLIKDMTLVAEYTGDVDYIKNRENDDCDSMMSLLLTKDPSKSLVVCPDKRGNIARFISGINNHAPESRKKQNLKCVRYSVDGECRVFLVAMRDISKGERLYYDYNGYEHEYPTHHFV